ncbi:MAG: adenylate/guanylate cyclase domain-containing protein [Treponema sp.]|jgi:adenylate cyclase|nr:adenylate/guanylate cyclase domain-containing protein [Treponema sp.]
MSKKKKYEERRSGLTVKFSIGAKLIIIISLIILISLGSITALVSWLVREDLKVSAEDNNFEVNRRAAVETEQTLQTMRAFSVMFMRNIASLGGQNSQIQKEADFFFTQNPQIAALIYTTTGQPRERVMVNEQYFTSRGISAGLADAYRMANQRTMQKAEAGQTVILNASIHFNTPLTALFFPVESGGGCVIFSPESLNESFGFGTNPSFLINADGGVIADADPDRVKAAGNLAEQEYIRSIIDSTDRNKQMLIEIEPQPGSQNAANEHLLAFLPATGQALARNAYTVVTRYTKQALDGISDLLSIEKKQNVQTQDSVKKVRHYLAYTKLNTAGCIVITSIEYDKVFEGIDATTRRNLYLTAAILFISIMFIWFFAKSISVPLKTLASAARAIQGGMFDVELTPKNRDEIGVLTAGFKQMCNALGIFGRFTNKDIAVRAMRGEIRPGGLPKHATIFFSDIREFTQKSENFTRSFGDEASDRIVHWLNEYLSGMVECVEKTGGVVDKFIGDAVMAHWGTATTAGSPEEDAFNCIKAALLMRLALQRMNQNRKDENLGNPPIRIGCGINTGIVTAGQIGSDLRMEYTVIGDPVNLASRTEALNKPLGTDILITENTWNLVKHCFITEEMPPVTVKGKKKPVRMFAVINFASASAGPKTLAEVRKRLGIAPPDISKVDVNADEHKYQIGEK